MRNVSAETHMSLCGRKIWFGHAQESKHDLKCEMFAIIGLGERNWIPSDLFKKRITVTKYLMILMTNVLSIPILWRTIDDSRIAYFGNRRSRFTTTRLIPTTPFIFSQNQAPLSTTSSRHEAPTAERTNTDFFWTLKRQFILELVSKGNFPASWPCLWYYLQCTWNIVRLKEYTIPAIHPI